MCTIHFYFRLLKIIDERSLGSLCVRFIYRRKSRSLSLGFRLYEDEWNFSCQKIIHPRVPNLRSTYLDQAETAMESCYNTFFRVIQNLENQGSYTVEEVVQNYRSNTMPGDLFVYCQRQAYILTKSGRERTARAYLSSVRSLIIFNRGKSLVMDDIDANLLKEYERYLKERGKSLNTISFYMRNLRALYNKSIEDNIIPARYKNPFSGVYTGVDYTRKRALSLEDAGRLRRVDPSCFPNSARLSRCQRLFFFCFYARGMSFIDLAYLRKDNIGKGIISYYRKKTGQSLEIKLTGEMLDIINSFSKETRFSPYVFPILTNKGRPLRLQYESALRVYNRDLKELARLAGIDQHISSHVARHSWATIAKYEHLPLSVISEGLGHRNEKTTYIYLASFERSRLDEANEIISHAVERVCADESYSPLW